jgi:hypothetical protein
MLTNRIRGLIAALVVLASSFAVVLPATSTARSHRHHRHHHSAIPQHNGGDHDADNRGAPSDGDGNV